jgi:hypothetical protein
VRVLALLLALFVAVPAFGSPETAQETELMNTLMSWAVKLSRYPSPDKVPTVEFVPQAFFDAHACGGRHCHVWGWYPNTGQDVVYVRDDIRELIEDGSDPRSLFAASIVVHEFVHYLQAAQRGFAPYDCKQALDLEREAYYAQAAYMQSYGRYFPVGVSMHTANCAGSASQEVTGKPSP